jgi:tellurite resistance protein
MENSRLQYFPIPFFAVVMGISGLTIVYQKAHEVFGFSSIFSDILIFIDTCLFIIISSTYLMKYIKYKDVVKKEFTHKIRVNFFAAISISMLLISIIYHDINSIVSGTLFFMGVALHTFLTLHTISFWINHNFEIMHTNPAWFIPIVGNVLVPIAGLGFVSGEFLFFYFSLGMFFWIVLFTINLNRIIFHNQLPAKFMPTLFILVAPPAIGFISYIKMGNPLDNTALFLYSMALFFSMLLGFMYKNFIKLKFFISWWAFTFPITAMTIATILIYKLTGGFFYEILAYLFIFISTAIISFVSYHTILNMMKKEICVLEE